jgi:ribose transport system permease protein
MSKPNKNQKSYTEPISHYTEPVTSNYWGSIKSTLLKSGPIIAFLLLAVYLSFASPYFLTGSNIVNIARQTSITAILAVGQTLVIITGGIDLSVGAIAAISASVAAVLMTQQFQIGSLVIGPLGVGW